MCACVIHRSVSVCLSAREQLLRHKLTRVPLPLTLSTAIESNEVRQGHNAGEGRTAKEEKKNTITAFYSQGAQHILIDGEWINLCVFAL